MLHASSGNPLASLYTVSLLPRTPLLSASNAGTVCSHDMQASVTDCPYFSPAGPKAGMSCRPSRRLDSSMTPMISPLVSGEESCFTYPRCKCWVPRRRRRRAYDIVDNIQLVLVLFLTVTMAAVDLNANESSESMGPMLQPTMSFCGKSAVLSFSPQSLTNSAA